MRIIIRCLLIGAFGIAVAVAETAQDVDRYRYFRDQGIFDAAVSNQTANDIVRDGITSSNEVIVNMTIKALSSLAIKVSFELPSPHGPIPPRSFPEVPGLKEFLIEHWKQQHEKNGYNIEQAIRRSQGMEDDSDRGGIAAADMDLKEDSDLDPGASMATFEKRLPAWVLIPEILCTFWPGDSDVQQLLWIFQDKDLSSNNQMRTLLLLNVGKFATPEADAFRISQLASPSGDPVASVGVMIAVAGLELAMNPPIDALPHLITAGIEHPMALLSVWVVVAGYDDNQLAPYTQELQSLLGHNVSSQSSSEVYEAYNRLVSFVDRMVQ